jgi:hypothetical protein
MIDTVEAVRPPGLTLTLVVEQRRWRMHAYTYMRGLILPRYAFFRSGTTSPCHRAAPRLAVAMPDPPGASCPPRARGGSLLYFAPVLLFINKRTDKRITRHGNLFNQEQ